jgi:hypothetical protein
VIIGSSVATRWGRVAGGAGVARARPEGSPAWRARPTERGEPARSYSPRGDAARMPVSGKKGEALPRFMAAKVVRKTPAWHPVACLSSALRSSGFQCPVLETMSRRL